MRIQNIEENITTKEELVDGLHAVVSTLKFRAMSYATRAQLAEAGSKYIDHHREQHVHMIANDINSELIEMLNAVLRSLVEIELSSRRGLSYAITHPQRLIKEILRTLR